MGCDIHTVAEIKSSYDKKWGVVGDNIANEWRSYDSFAVLANVRNGCGFAGVKTGEGWEPIAEPRGLPKDSPYSEDDTDDCEHCGHEKSKWLGDHSHSWVTLKELKEKLDTYQNEEYKISGVVGKDEWDLCLKEKRNPESWCGGASGPNIVIANKEKYAIMSDAEKDKVSYVSAAWEVHALWRLKWLTLVVKHLELLRDSAYSDVDDDNIRLVFGFDS